MLETDKTDNQSSKTVYVWWSQTDSKSKIETTHFQIKSDYSTDKIIRKIPFWDG